jgi:SAM-dependent methyltransferase
MDSIQKYWNNRAEDTGAAQNATTNDVFLRQLEVSTVSRELENAKLKSGAKVLDVGCGDGRTTLELAKTFGGVRFYGIDFSSSMIELARSNLAGKPELADRVKFGLGDARHLESVVGRERYDVIVTNRCLINLSLKEEQYGAIRQIADHIVDGGLFVGTENFVGGQDELNRLRLSVGLPEIPVRWHNLYFSEKEFLDECKKFFQSIDLESFSSSYYYATRVIYSALCEVEGLPLDYQHPIHRVALKLPPVGDFSPIKLIRARR